LINGLLECGQAAAANITLVCNHLSSVTRGIRCNNWCRVYCRENHEDHLEQHNMYNGVVSMVALDLAKGIGWH